MEEVFFDIVRNNRECHPGGERVYLMNAQQAEEQEIRCRRAEKELMEMQVQNRLSAMAVLAVCWVAALAGFLLGLAVCGIQRRQKRRSCGGTGSTWKEPAMWCYIAMKPPSISKSTRRGTPWRYIWGTGNGKGASRHPSQNSRRNDR